ncbi:MAG: AmmeMemoRadiSam system radical SAM enzyme [Candidatus Melainabacteria bacterium]|nr:AmmeMemoRadiSam system radical SAM enzyme [Candidatus Melainabacteria bacterium]
MELNNQFTRKGRYWHPTETQGQIHCDLCPRACVLKEGDRGFCFIRQNLDGEMYLTSYGLSTGFCVDPVEKKPLNHFLPGTSILSFGTAGCNLGCRFCQNWDISKSREIERLSERAFPEDIAEAALRLGCRSVAFTYNDPVIWLEYAVDTARACREAGIKTVAVTAGYITPEARPEFYAQIDAANVDLKGFSERFYKQLTLSELAPVLDTLKWLKHESDVWFEITNLIIPGENDSTEELKGMCDWIVTNLGEEVPVHFTAFHPDFKLIQHQPTPANTLIEAREIAIAAGIKFAYTGNVNDKKRQSTYCPKCQNLLIERDWFELGKYNIKKGCCNKCGTKISGVFEDKKGNWGRKRLPILFDK